MSTNLTIQCPHCTQEFPLTAEHLSSMRTEIATELRAQQQELITKATTEAANKAKETQALELQSAQKELAEQKIALKASREKELHLLKQEQKLQEEKEELNLQVQRQLQQERQSLLEKARKKADEENSLAIAEKEKLIQELRTQLQTAQRKTEQGSQQTQGEVFELAFEEELRRHFPSDLITPVKTGARGADLAMQIQTPLGKSCGQILFENKRTQSFSKPWIDKLKSNMQEAKADLGVLVTTALPKEVEHFACIEGIWITDFPHAIALTAALRQQLLEVSRTRTLQQGAQDKASILYEYITGNEFRQNVELIHQHFNNLREQLRKERDYMNKAWAARETHIHQIMDQLGNTTGQMQALTQSEALEFGE